MNDQLPGIRKIYVDAYNLLFFLHPQPPIAIEEIRDKLVRKVRRFSKQIHIPVDMIFDGKDGSRYPGMIFTKGQTADEELIQIAQAHKRSQKILMVTSDRALITQLEKCHIATMNCNSFWRLVQNFEPVEKREKPKSAEGMEDYLMDFAELDEMLATINKPPTEVPKNIIPLKKKKKQGKTKPLNINTDKDHVPSKDEIDFWMKEFGFEE